MKKERFPLVALLLLATFFGLSACKKTADTAKKITSGSGTTLQSSSILPLPGAPLGLFVSTYLAGGNTTPVSAPLTGVTAQVKLHTEYDPMKNTDTFPLLQELGNTLTVDIPDLLNRSTDRPATLNTYIDALKNITERSKGTLADLNAHLKTIQQNEKDQNTTVSGLQKRMDQANRTSDYATAGELQQDLTDAKTKLATMQAEEKATKDTAQTFQNLTAIADKRIDAIETNREILIAGLKVVNVPGTENLDILQKGSSSAGFFLP